MNDKDGKLFRNFRWAKSQYICVSRRGVGETTKGKKMNAMEVFSAKAGKFVANSNIQG